MHYGVIRYFRDEFELEFTPSENREIVTHLGAVNKSLRKKGKGILSNKSDALTNKETNMLFEKGAAGKHHPTAIQIFYPDLLSRFSHLYLGDEGVGSKEVYVLVTCISLWLMGINS